jgi:hypothetical protein
MTTPPRPDQEIDPPAQVIAPGGNAGIFRGRLIIVNGVAAPPGSGIFIYNNAGALIGSWVGAAGTDPVDGEAVLLGFTVQNPAGTISANMQSGSLIIEKFSGVVAPPQIQVLDDTAVPGTASNTVLNAAGIVTPIIQAVTPGDNTGGAETWHTLGSPSATGYTTGHGRYRMSPEGETEFDIVLTANGGGGTAGTYTFANTLPAAYQPATNRSYPLGYNGTITAGQNFPALRITTAGAVILQIPALPATTVITGTVYMPLD